MTDTAEKLIDTRIQSRDGGTPCTLHLREKKYDSMTMATDMHRISNFVSDKGLIAHLKLTDKNYGTKTVVALANLKTAFDKFGDQIDKAK